MTLQQDPLPDRLAKAAADRSVALVVLDLASVETYLLAQPLSWLAMEDYGALWLPLLSRPAPLDGDRHQAQLEADGLQLHLAWPKRHPEPLGAAMRVALLASAHSRATPFMFAMSTLAFGSGCDLDEPEQYAPSAREAGLHARDIDEAARPQSTWEADLRRVAEQLRVMGIDRAPALRWQGELHLGSEAIRPLLPAPPDGDLPALRHLSIGQLKND